MVLRAAIAGIFNLKALTMILCMAVLGAPSRAAGNWQLAIHGGAGVIERGSLTPEKEAAYRAGLNAALEAGAKVLRAGGSSLDAVEAAVRQWHFRPAQITQLEDAPLPGGGSYKRVTSRESTEAQFDLVFTFTETGKVEAPPKAPAG